VPEMTYKVKRLRTHCSLILLMLLQLTPLTVLTLALWFSLGLLLVFNLRIRAVRVMSMARFKFGAGLRTDSPKCMVIHVGQWVL